MPSGNKIFQATPTHLIPVSTTIPESCRLGTVLTDGELPRGQEQWKPPMGCPRAGPAVRTCQQQGARSTRAVPGPGTALGTRLGQGLGLLVRPSGGHWSQARPQPRPSMAEGRSLSCSSPKGRGVAPVRHFPSLPLQQLLLPRFLWSWQGSIPPKILDTLWFIPGYEFGGLPV